MCDVQQCACEKQYREWNSHFVVCSISIIVNVCVQSEVLVCVFSKKQAKIFESLFKKETVDGA